MINDATIRAARTLFACCSFEYLRKYSVAQMYGEKDMYNRNLWLYMLWAKSVMSRTDIGSETDGCVTREFADDVFQKAKCFCEMCLCGESTPTPVDCTITTDFTVDLAVDATDLAAAQAAHEVEGYTIFIATFPGIGYNPTPGQITTYTSGVWQSVAVPDGNIVLDSNTGTYWVSHPYPTWPLMLFPAVNGDNNGGGSYSIVSQFPPQAAGSQRVAIVEMSIDGTTWDEVFNGPESDLAVPYSLVLSESGYTQTRVTYVSGSCTYQYYDGFLLDNNPPASARSLQGDCNYIANSTPAQGGIDYFGSPWTISVRVQNDGASSLYFRREVLYSDGNIRFAPEILGDSLYLMGTAPGGAVDGLYITYDGLGVNDGLWHTVVITRNPAALDDWSASAVRVYVDGVLVNPTASTLPSYGAYTEAPDTLNVIVTGYADEIYACSHVASLAEVNTVFIPNQMQAYDATWGRSYWYRIEETDTPTVIANDVTPANPASNLFSVIQGIISTNVDPLIA